MESVSGEGLRVGNFIFMWFFGVIEHVCLAKFENSDLGSNPRIVNTFMRNKLYLH